MSEEETLNLELNWTQAKVLQIAIAYGKHHVRDTVKKVLEDIEKTLETFTETSSLVFHIPKESE